MRNHLLGRASHRAITVAHPPFPIPHHPLTINHSGLHLRVCEMPEGKYRLHFANVDGYAYLVSDSFNSAIEPTQIGRFLAAQSGLPFQETILR